MFVVLISVFNEAPGIARAIESVHDYADEVRVYDGAYSTFPHDSFISTDGTIDIVKSWSKVRTIIPDHPYSTQMEKRTRMLSDCEEGEIVLILDGDEFLVRPELIGLCSEQTDWDVGWLWIISGLYSQPYRQPRLFRCQKGLHYAGRHYWIFDAEKKLFASHQAQSLQYRNLLVDGRILNLRRLSREKAKASFRTARNRFEELYQAEGEVYGQKELLAPAPQRCSEVRSAFQIFKFAVSPRDTAIIIFEDWRAAWRLVSFLFSSKISTANLELVSVDAFASRVSSIVLRLMLRALRFKLGGLRNLVFRDGDAHQASFECGLPEKYWWLLIPEIRTPSALILEPGDGILSTAIQRTELQCHVDERFHHIQSILGLRIDRAALFELPIPFTS